MVKIDYGNFYKRLVSLDPRFFVQGELDERGNLSLTFSTKVMDKQGRPQYSKLVAKDEFAAIMDFFGDRVKQIELVYTLQDDDLPLDDMLSKVNAQTGRGVPVQRAIGNTFFAIQAARYGFDDIIVDVPNGELPGSFDHLNIFIRKSR